MNVTNTATTECKGLIVTLVFVNSKKSFFSTFSMSDFGEQRSFIKFCVPNEISAAETSKMLQKAFSDQALSKTRTFEWHKMFREGKERVEDKGRPGPETISTDGQHVMEIKDLVLHNHRLTIRDLANTIGI